MMRWFRPDGLVGLVVLIAVVAAGYAVLLPVAVNVDAPDELLGVAHLVWWALCQLGGLGVGVVLLRLPRLLRLARRP